MMLNDQQMIEAIGRIAHTPDGHALYLFLQKTITAVPPLADADALRSHHGRRTFAAELMAAMAEGIRDSHGGRDPTDHPIVFVTREPVRLAGRESAREHLARTDVELNPTGPTGGGRIA
jgi:hypothetical protein